MDIQSHLNDLAWNDLKRYAKASCAISTTAPCANRFAIDQDNGVKVAGSREELTREILKSVGAAETSTDVRMPLQSTNKLNMMVSPRVTAP